MKTNFKGSTGNIFVSVDNEIGLLISSQKPYCDIATVHRYGHKNLEDTNAKLIIDAFNIRQQINCDLPELLERYNKAVELLEKSKTQLNPSTFYGEIENKKN